MPSFFNDDHLFLMFIFGFEVNKTRNIKCRQRSGEIYCWLHNPILHQEENPKLRSKCIFRTLYKKKDCK